MLLARSEKSESHSERARALNQIGHLYVRELEDKEQGAFAFAQALAQETQNDEYATDLEEGANAELDAALEGVFDRHPGLELRKLVEQEDAVAALVEAGREAELLVVGSHGRGAFARLFLGSVSHGVLTNLVAPVAVIR